AGEVVPKRERRAADSGVDLRGLELAQGPAVEDETGALADAVERLDGAVKPSEVVEAVEIGALPAAVEVEGIDGGVAHIDRERARLETREARIDPGRAEQGTPAVERAGVKEAGSFGLLGHLGGSPRAGFEAWERIDLHRSSDIHYSWPTSVAGRV